MWLKLKLAWWFQRCRQYETLVRQRTTGDQKAHLSFQMDKLTDNRQCFWGFKKLGVISYIMYIVVTSDVNKNATFWGVLLRSQELINAENIIFQSNFHCWASVCLQSILTGNSGRKYTNQCFLDGLRKWPRKWYSCASDPRQI